MLNKIIVFFEKLWLRGIKNWWSKLRWYSKSKEESYDVPLVTTDEEIIEVAKDVYAHFNWEMDNIKDAFDTYYPIPYAYNLYFQAKQLNGTFSGDCFTGDTKIKCLDGNAYSFKELIDNNVQELWVYGCLPNGEIIPTKAILPRAKETNKKLVRVTLDNGETFTCTEDHLLMLRNGEYKAVKDIVPNEDSLMPGYFRFGKLGNYLEVKNNHTNKYELVHVVVNNYVNYDIKEQAQQRATNLDGQDKILVTHHIDCNKYNNLPSNLIWLTWKEHRDIHAHDGVSITKYNKSEAHREVAKKLGPVNGKNRLIEYNKSDDHRKMVSEMNKNSEFTKLRFRGHILHTIQDLISSGKDFNEENYNSNRRSHATPRWCAITKYIDSVQEAYESAKTYNHKISSIEYLNESELVYDITVPETHNFLLDCGIFVHNCDDFHGVILHILNQNNFDAAAITLATIPITESHTMTAFKRINDNGSVEYYVVNYTRLLGPYYSLQDFVDDYGTPVRYWCLQKYNYDKGMYYNIDKEDF